MNQGLSEEQIRIEALKCSIQLGTQNVIAPDARTDLVIRRAIKFEEYIVLGKEVGA